MSLGLVLRQFFGRPLYVGTREVKVFRLAIATSPPLLFDDVDEWRPATREELVAFVKRYNLKAWHTEIYAVDPEVQPSPFGPITRIYKAGGQSVEQAGQNPLLGLPAGTLVLFVKDVTGRVE